MPSTPVMVCLAACVLATSAGAAPPSDQMADYYGNTSHITDKFGYPVRGYYNPDHTFTLVRRSGVHHGTWSFDPVKKVMCLRWVGTPPPDRVDSSPGEECLPNYVPLKMGQTITRKHPDGSLRQTFLTHGRLDTAAGIEPAPAVNVASAPDKNAESAK